MSNTLLRNYILAGMFSATEGWVSDEPFSEEDIQEQRDDAINAIEDEEYNYGLFIGDSSSLYDQIQQNRSYIDSNFSGVFVDWPRDECADSFLQGLFKEFFTEIDTKSIDNILMCLHEWDGSAAEAVIREIAQNELTSKGTLCHLVAATEAHLGERGSGYEMPELYAAGRLALKRLESNNLAETIEFDVLRWYRVESMEEVINQFIDVDNTEHMTFLNAAQSTMEKT